MATNRFHVEAWSLPLDSTAKVVDRVPFISGSFTDELARGGVGRGELVVPADWERLPDVSDPDNDVETLLRVFRDGTLVGSFFARRAAKALEDQDTVTITGAGLSSVLAAVEIENYDYPDRPSVDPDWSWGDGATLNGFRNGSFEDSEDPETGKIFDVSTYFEDQTTQGWDDIPAGGDWVDNTTGPTVDSGDAQSGTYSLTFDPGTAKSGIRKRIVVQGGGAYTWQVYLKATSGSRFVFGVDLPDGGTATHTNAHVYNKIALADLANAAKGAGSSDGTWQLTQLAVTMPTFSSNPDQNWRYVYLYVYFDDTGTGPAGTRIDALTSTGPGFGLLPWKKSGPGVSSFAQSTTHVDDGTYSAHLVTTTTNDGLRQIVRGIAIGRTLTFTARVYHTTGSNQDFLIRMRRWKGRGVLASDTVSVPTATWTTLTVTGEVDQDELLFDVVKATSGEFWVDTADVYAGQGPASWGAINIELLDDLTTDHTAESGQYALDALGFLDYTGFTATLDSASNAWSPATVEYRAKRGRKFSQIATDGQRQGYEHYISDNVSTGPAYDVYNPHDWTTRTGGVGSNLVGTGVPELRYGAGVTSGPVVKSPAGANRVHIEGTDGMWDVRRDATKISAFGTRMLYEGDPNFLGDDTVGQVADRLLEERTVPTVALKVNLEPGDDPDIPTPYAHFNIGDTYPIDLAGDFTGSKRVVKITTDFTPGYGRYTVEFDNPSYTSDPQKALAEAVRRLLEKVDDLDAPEDESEPVLEVIESIDGGGIYPTYLVAASNSRTAIKEIADYVCDGTADEEEINDALTLCDSATRGRVVLADGTYTQTAGSTITVYTDCALEGINRDGATIVGDSGTVTTIQMEDASRLAHLTATNTTVTKTGVFASNVVLHDLWLLGSLTAHNYVLITSDTGWQIDSVYIYGGLLAGAYVGGTNAQITRLWCDLSNGKGLIIQGDYNAFSTLLVTSPDEVGIDLTSFAQGNVISGVVRTPNQTTAGVGVNIAGDNNIVTGLRVTASGNTTYTLEVAATGDSNILGVYELDTGTSGTVNDAGTNTYDYRTANLSTSGGSLSGDLDPASDNAYDLGDSTNSWRNITAYNLYDEAGVLRIDTSGQWRPASHVWPTADGTVQLGAVGGAWAGVYTYAIHDESGTLLWDTSGNLNLNGSFVPITDNVTDFGTAAKSLKNIFTHAIMDEAGTTRLDLSHDWTPGQHIIPETDNNSDLGSAALSFKDVYAAALKDQSGNLQFASGSDTIADTNSSVTVTHGIGTTPGSVTVTPQGDDRIWVTTVGATTFQVNRAGTSGAFSFYWTALA